MKHLKPFNESLSFDEIKSDIKDICLELSDMGLKVTVDYVESYRFSGTDFILIAITTTPKSFIYTQEIHEVILRVLDYMKITGYEPDMGRWKIYKNNIYDPHNIVRLIDDEIYSQDKNIYSQDKNIKNELIETISISFKKK